MNEVEFLAKIKFYLDSDVNHYEKDRAPWHPVDKN